MEWIGSAFGVAGLVISVVSVRVAIQARGDSNRSADASVRAAVAAEQGVALAREEAEERRQAARPRPKIALHHVSGATWVLRNDGDAPAGNVTVLPESMTSQVGEAPPPVDLVPGAGERIMMAGSFAVPVPSHLMVMWDGLDGPVAVPVPPATPRRPAG